jgi:hypothetical protein
MSIAWHQPLENVIKKIAEQTQALSWAHNHANVWCSSWDTRISIITIVMGIFSGAGAVGTQALLPFPQANTVIGIVSLVTSTIQAVNSKLAFGRRSEGHRVASLAYNQIYNKLNIQLNMPRNERMKADELLNWITTEMERLTEVEPIFPDSTKKIFHSKFGSLDNYTLPLTLNGLQPIDVITHSTTAESESVESPAPMKKPIIKLAI